MTTIIIENLPQNTPISKSTSVSRHSFVKSHNYRNGQKHTLNAREMDQNQMIDGEPKTGRCSPIKSGAKSQRILAREDRCLPVTDSSSGKNCETTIVRDLIKEDFMLLRIGDRKDKGSAGIDEVSFGEGSGCALRHHSNTGQHFPKTSRDNVKLYRMKATASSCEGTDSPKKLSQGFRAPRGKFTQTLDGQLDDMCRVKQGNAYQSSSNGYACKHEHEGEWKRAEEAEIRGRLTVGQLPSKDTIAEERTTCKSSSLRRAVSAQKIVTHEIKNASMTKRTRKLSLERGQQKRSWFPDDRQSNKRAVHCTKGAWSLDATCIYEPCNSVQETPLASRSIASDKQENILESLFPKRRESLERSSSRDKAENGTPDSSKLISTPEEVVASHSQDGNFSHGQLLRRRWSIERINSYSFDRSRSTNNEGNLGKMQNTGTEDLRLDAMPNVSDRPAQIKARIFRNERHRKLSDTTWMKTPQKISGTDNIPEPLHSLVILNKGSTNNNCKKVIDKPNKIENGVKITEGKSIVDDAQKKVKEGKKQNEENCKRLNAEYFKKHNTVNRNFSERRRMARELLRQKLFQNESDSDSYSDDDLWKEVKIVMTSEKLKGILRVKTPGKSKTVTFSNKVKMKTVYCL